MSKTQEKEKTYQRVGGNLPPLFLLDVGQTLEGEILEAAVVVNKDKKGKEKGSRMFYRIKLDESATGLDAEKNEITYKAGDVVSFPGAGGFDYAMKLVASKEAGIELDDFEDKNFESLNGIHIRIHRREDEKMKKGAWKGKFAKAFDVDKIILS